MGMFDWLRCEYPLPVEDAPFDGWQTKDTPNQTLDLYTIRADGSLWVQEYDIEDRSDPDAKGLDALIGSMERVNHRDIPCAFTGEIQFYTHREVEPPRYWIEISAYFQDGHLQKLDIISDGTEP